MKHLGEYPIGLHPRIPSSGIVHIDIDVRAFVALNTIALFREVLPLELDKGIKISFHYDLTKFGCGLYHDTRVISRTSSHGRWGLAELVVREPKYIINKIPSDPLSALWWVCYRLLRSYMVQTNLIPRDHLMTLDHYEKLGMQDMVQAIYDGFSAFKCTPDQLPVLIDNALVTNVIMRKLAQAWINGKDVCPIHDFGPLLFVTRHDFKKLL